MKYINIDAKRQHLVSNIVNFAIQNNIKTIAEGIENFEEFITVIGLGIDYIQGFYTARPAPYFLRSLLQEHKDAILDINRKKSLESMEKRVYETNADQELSLVALALDQYTDILVREKELTLKGSQGLVANINIHIPDNMKCHLTLENIDIKGNDNPSISLGHNCNVELFLIGDNNITDNGIRVPESSMITILGDGNLNINSKRLVAVGIGGTGEQSYGDIVLAATGTIKVYKSDNTSAGIGGAQNSNNSRISLCSGNISVISEGLNTVGIGSIYSNAIVSVKDCRLEVKTMGVKTVGIGSLHGHVSIDLDGDITVNSEGRYTVVIGSAENGQGYVNMLGGTIHSRFNAHSGSGIGSIGGNVDITILNGSYHLYAEGTDIVGIGDQTGNGRIGIYNGIININLNSSNQLPVGNISKKVVIQGGNILCGFSDDRRPVNAYQVPLVARSITTTSPFTRTIEAKEGLSYEYNADYCELYPNIIVYLPEEIIL